MRLTRVDLPTLGRPATTTRGRVRAAGLAAGRGHRGAPMLTGTRAGAGGADGWASRASRARRSDRPSVGTTSTARGRSARVRSSRKRPSDRQESGSRYRWPSGWSASTRGEVGAGQEARHADVAPEEVVADGDEADVVPPERGDEGGEHPGTVLTGEDGHRRARALPSAPRAGGGVADGPTGRPVAGGRGAVDGGEEPGTDAEGGVLVAPEGRLEGPGHAQAVLVLGEALVGGGGREGPLGHQVVLVGGVDHPAAEAARGRSPASARRGRTPRRPPRRCGGAWRPRGRTCSPRGARRPRWRGPGSGRARRPGCPPGRPRRCGRGTPRSGRGPRSPPSRSAPSQRRLVAPRRLRSRSARTSGSVAWIETNSGLSRSVSTRSRSISVNRVSVVKLP